MNFKRYHVSKNLLNRATDILGYRLGQDGTPFPDSAYEVSEFIAITPNTYISRSENFTINRPLCEYDAEKNHIKRTTSGSSVLLTNNTYYVRTAVEQTNVDVMLNTGGQPLPYEPYSSEVWHDIPHYIHNTSTDTFTTLPADLYADGNNATVGISGNMVQNGTPTPDNPVMPQGTGERTGNLWSFYPEQTLGDVTLSWNGEKISYSGTCTSSNSFTMNIKLKAGTYTLKANANRNPIDNSYSCIDIYRSSPLFMAVIANREAVEGSKTFTIDEDMDAILRIRVNVGVNYDGFEIRPMLNSGSTPLPYEPYGIKIPISSASTTTPVYLGEVQTTRKIKKLVLTGEENWSISGSGDAARFYINIADAVGSSSLYCTHFTNGIQTTIGNCEITASKNLVFNNSEIATTTANWKTWLQQQYANGTPVTIWYVLAEPTTGIVNEPLRKIGDYADTVSGITIPTIAGANTLSVDTTLQPSEVSVNYKGWHPVADVHEAENGQWD